MDERIAFWANPKGWPEDVMGYVFLGNAVDRVGKFLFPTEWDGSENTTPELYSLKISANGADFRLPEPMAKPWQKRIVHELVASRRLEFGREYTIRHTRTGGGIPDFSQDEWAAGLEEAEKIDAQRKPRLDRREATQRFIKRAVLDGELRFVLLPQRGGAFSAPQDRMWWYVRDIDRIFYWCQMNPLNPTGTGVGGNDFQHVFVDELDLKILTHPRDNEWDLPQFGTTDFSDRPVPRPTDFDVMEVEDWSVEMVLAWILWRDPVQVLRFDRDYYKALTVDECIFDTIPAPTLGGLQELLQTEASIDDISLDVAVRRLRSALRSGHIVADATDLMSMTSQPIPADDWKRLIAVSDSAQRTVLANNYNTFIYGDVWFDREEVVRRWPRDGDWAPMDTDGSPLLRPVRIENEPGSDTKKKRRNTKRGRVEAFLDQFFPDGIPDLSDMSDGHLAKLVGDAMDEAARRNPRLEKAPSRDTILRAAGRKESDEQIEQ